MRSLISLEVDDLLSTLHCGVVSPLRRNELRHFVNYVQRSTPLGFASRTGFMVGPPRRNRPCVGYCRSEVKLSAATATLTRTPVFQRRYKLYASGTLAARLMYGTDFTAKAAWCHSRRLSFAFRTLSRRRYTRVCDSLGDCLLLDKIWRHRLGSLQPRPQHGVALCVHVCLQRVTTHE